MIIFSLINDHGDFFSLHCSNHPEYRPISMSEKTWTYRPNTSFVVDIVRNYEVFLVDHISFAGICHFRNDQQSGASRISQSLVGPLLGTKWRPAWRRVPSNCPTSDCEMRLAPDCFSFLKWWMVTYSFYSIFWKITSQSQIRESFRKCQCQLLFLNISMESATG